MDSVDGTDDRIEDASLKLAKKMADVLLKNSDIQEALDKDSKPSVQPKDKLNKYNALGELKGKDNRKILEDQIRENEEGCVAVLLNLETFVEQKIYELLRDEGLVPATGGTD
tara:strand:+ start:7344 stop:7679 length:336 start_codon:yes stop_codon:yes gene_type:complete